MSGGPELGPCRTRRCVSTQAPRTDPLRRIEPLAIGVSAASAMESTLRVLRRLPRHRILERDAVSVHAVERSDWLGFPTDIEVRIDDAAGLLHLRVTTARGVRGRTDSRTRAIQLLAAIEHELRGI